LKTEHTDFFKPSAGAQYGNEGGKKF